MTRPVEEEVARVARVEAMTGHTFRDPSAVLDALTHASYSNEHGVRDYERLEFLGDALVNMHAAVRLFEAHPGAQEGMLTDLRQRVIDTTRLGMRGRELGLGDLVWRGRGHLREGPASDALLEDIVESVFGALFVDGGFDATRAFAETVLAPLVAVAADGPVKNPVNRLQELTRVWFGVDADYQFEESGPDHARRHIAHVMVAKRKITTGDGRSKSDARKNAAQLAIVILEREASEAASEAEATAAAEASEAIAAAAEAPAAEPSPDAP